MYTISKIAATGVIIASLCSGIVSLPVYADTPNNGETEYLTETPVVEYKTCRTLKTAIKTAGFTFCVPDAPKDYPNINYKIRPDVSRVYANYSDDDGNVVYTIIIQPDDEFEDISGDDTYESLLNLSMGGKYYTMFGPEKGKITKVTWRDNGFNFAFVSTSGKTFPDSNIKTIVRSTAAIEGVKETAAAPKVTLYKSQKQAATALGHDFEVPAANSEYPVVYYAVERGSNRLNVIYENGSGERCYTISIQQGDQEEDLNDEFKVYSYNQDLVRGKTKYHKFGSGQNSVTKVTWYKDGYNYLIIRTDDEDFSSDAVSGITKKIKVKSLDNEKKGTKPATSKPKKDDTVVTSTPASTSKPTDTTVSETATTPAAEEKPSTAGGKTFTNLDEALDAYGAYIYLPMSKKYTATSYVVGKNGAFTANYKMAEGSGTFKIDITKGKWNGNTSSMPYAEKSSVKLEDGMSDTGYREYFLSGDTENEWKMMKWSINGYTYSVTVSNTTFTTQEISDIANFVLVE